MAALLGISIAAQAEEPASPPLPLRTLTDLNLAHDGTPITLVARPQHHAFGDVGFDGAAYNGDYAGPLIHARPGEELTIRLVNALHETTNLHFHGLETGPRANGDNVHIVVRPGHSFVYHFRIPVDQPPGLYWYHAHIHKLSEEQIAQGLSGGLLIEGFAAPFPELAHIKERVLVLKDKPFDETDDPILDQQYHRLIQTINGQTRSTLTMAPHATELWHISNQSADLFFHLAIPGMTLRVIGEDGVTRTAEETVEHIDIAPAKRFAVLVTAGEPGTMHLLSQRVATGVGAAYTLNRVLATISVEGNAGAAVASIAAFPPSEDLRKRKIDTRRELVYTQSKDGNSFMIDGKKFDPDRVDVRVPLGHTEAWTIFNDTDDVHTFHIHQVHFQLVDVDGTPQPFVGHVDTVVVHERVHATVIIPFDHPDIIGRFMYHCHMLEHEDKGMMGQIEIYDPADETVLRKLWRVAVRALQARFPGSAICRIKD